MKLDQFLPYGIIAFLLFRGTPSPSPAPTTTTPTEVVMSSVAPVANVVGSGLIDTAQNIVTNPLGLPGAAADFVWSSYQAGQNFFSNIIQPHTEAELSQIAAHEQAQALPTMPGQVPYSYTAPTLSAVQQLFPNAQPLQQEPVYVNMLSIGHADTSERALSEYVPGYAGNFNIATGQNEKVPAPPTHANYLYEVWWSPANNAYREAWERNTGLR